MRIITLILPVFLAGICDAQQGLLVNGGFEDVNVCTEYNVECAPEAWMSSSAGFINYFKDANRSHSGINCMAIEAAHYQKKYNRSYLRTQLVCGMRKGSVYNLEFFIKSIHPILDSIGILFTATDPLYGNTFMRGKEPAVYVKGHVQPNEFGDSTWRKVSLSYRATGEEVFMLIGYFGKEDYRGERLNPLENRYHVFFDDFSLMPADPGEHLCESWSAMKEEIYAENERHDLLERKKKYYRTTPPEPPQLERNVIVAIDTLVLPDILFRAGKADLQPGSFAVLDSIAASARNKQVDSLVLRGHTDNTGTSAANELLSQNRAKAVADYIAPRVSQKPVPVFTYGLADRQPVSDNGTPAGRQKNRRVEILIYLRE